MQIVRNIPRPLLIVATYFVFSTVASLWWFVTNLGESTTFFPLIWGTMSATTAFFVVRGRFKPIVYLMSILPLIGSVLWVPLGAMAMYSTVDLVFTRSVDDLLTGFVNPQVQSVLGMWFSLFAISLGSWVLPFAFWRMNKEPSKSHFD